MRLLRAELRKLNRPLLWGLTVAAMLFCVLLAVGGSANASGRTRPCTGVDCTVGRMMALTVEVHTAEQLDPVAAGAEAAGLMASLPGALVIALLAGGHVGGEWSGRTLKNVLTQCGHRWRVLAAKLVSLWLAGIGVLAACWAALAVAGPLIVAADHLPDPHQPVTAAAALAGEQAGRALLVLALFAAIGVLAAVLTRGTIGTMTAAAGTVLLMLVVAALPGTAAWTPATWVQGWMGFGAGQKSITALPDNYWSRFIDSGAAPPGHLAGLVGLTATLVVCAVAAAAVFRRTDVT